MPYRSYGRSRSRRTPARQPPVETSCLKVIRPNQYYVVEPITIDSLGHNNNISNRISVGELNEFFESLKAVNNYDLTNQMKENSKYECGMLALQYFSIVIDIIAASVAENFIWVSCLFL